MILIPYLCQVYNGYSISLSVFFHSLLENTSPEGPIFLLHVSQPALLTIYGKKIEYKHFFRNFHKHVCIKNMISEILKACV